MTITPSRMGNDAHGRMTTITDSKVFRSASQIEWIEHPKIPQRLSRGIESTGILGVSAANSAEEAHTCQDTTSTRAGVSSVVHRSGNFTNNVSSHSSG